MTKTKSLTEAELRKKYALKEVSKFHRNIMRFINKFNKGISEAEKVFSELSACEKDTILRILNVEATSDLEHQMACQKIFDEGRREVYATAYSMPVELYQTQKGYVKAKGTYGDWRVLDTKKSLKNTNHGDWRVPSSVELSTEGDAEQNSASYLPITIEEAEIFERLKERKALKEESRFILEKFHLRFVHQPIEHLRDPEKRKNLVREEEEQRLKQIAQDLKAMAGSENKKRTLLTKIIRQFKSQDGK